MRPKTVFKHDLFRFTLKRETNSFIYLGYFFPSRIIDIFRENASPLGGAVVNIRKVEEDEEEKPEKDVMTKETPENAILLLRRSSEDASRNVSKGRFSFPHLLLYLFFPSISDSIVIKIGHFV